MDTLWNPNKWAFKWQRKIIPLVKYNNPTYSKSTTHIDNNNNNSSSKYTTPTIENNKYINNNKYNNYKNRFNDNRRIYSAEDFEKLYANDF